MTICSITSAPERVILRLAVEQLAPGLYEYRIAHGSEELDSCVGHASIKEALEAAAGITGDIKGFEISYGGLVVGTYPAGMVKTSAEAIAQRAIETASALSGD